MANILVLQHSEKGRPGRIGRALRDHGFRLDIRRPDRADPLPPDLDDIHGLLVLGGPQNVDEGHDWMRTEKSLIAQAHAAELPVVGICLGCQLIAEALGGEVARMPQPEQGFAPVTLTIAGQTEPLLAGVPWTHHQFQSHAYGVTRLPAEAVLLMSSSASPVQAFRVGLRTCAFQFHFEVDRAMVEAFSADDDFNARAGVDRAALARQAEEHYDRFAVIADRIVENLLTYTFPATTLLRV
ncbi:MAG: type 1 glutamine amidotransferase [Phycisphaeraceae bacterium]|nr:type 1 glutamine amidotransferase [Phycisphaeraceae bacterium]MCW5754803.1 type 1 glutamine amidotransferase [Phycisphaeraceae bacterium]